MKDPYFRLVVVVVEPGGNGDSDPALGGNELDLRFLVQREEQAIGKC